MTATHTPTLEDAVRQAVLSIGLTEGRDVVITGDVTLNDGSVHTLVTIPWEYATADPARLDALYAALPDWVLARVTHDGPYVAVPHGDPAAWRDIALEDTRA